MCVSHTLPGSQPIRIQGTPGGKHQGGGRVTCLPPVFCTLPYLPVVLYSSTSSLLTHSLPLCFNWASSRMLIRMCILYVHFGMWINPLQLCIFLAQVSLWLSTESPRKQKKASQTSHLPKSPFQTSLTHKFGGHRNSGAHIQTISGALKPWLMPSLSSLHGGEGTLPSNLALLFSPGPGDQHVQVHQQAVFHKHCKGTNETKAVTSMALVLVQNISHHQGVFGHKRD